MIENAVCICFGDFALDMSGISFLSTYFSVAVAIVLVEIIIKISKVDYVERSDLPLF